VAPRRAAQPAFSAVERAGGGGGGGLGRGQTSRWPWLQNAGPARIEGTEERSGICQANERRALPLIWPDSVGPGLTEDDADPGRRRTAETRAVEAMWGNFWHCHPPLGQGQARLRTQWAEPRDESLRWRWRLSSCSQPPLQRAGLPGEQLSLFSRATGRAARRLWRSKCRESSTTLRSERDASLARPQNLTTLV
jgi:hypothetical protein